jgi:hypothetical protein
MAEGKARPQSMKYVEISEVLPTNSKETPQPWLSQPKPTIYCPGGTNRAEERKPSCRNIYDFADKIMQVEVT